MILKEDEYINTQCDFCGKQYHLNLYRVHRSKTHFCNRECFRQYKKISMLGEGNHQYGLRGSKNSSWKGGKRITTCGYYKMYSPDHPFQDCDHYVFEHRLVAEKFLLTEENTVIVDEKKYLSPDYIVHHKDGNKLNNNPNNLEIMKKSNHTTLHNLENPRPHDPTTGQFI